MIGVKKELRNCVEWILFFLYSIYFCIYFTTATTKGYLRFSEIKYDSVIKLFQISTTVYSFIQNKTFESEMNSLRIVDTKFNIFFYRRWKT